MARATTVRKRSGPPSSKARKASDDVAKARESLAALLEEDQGAAETGGYSVRVCAAMLRFWQARFLQAEQDEREAKDPGARAVARADLLKASQEAGEWEKRKAGASASEKLDTLKAVLRRLDEQEQAASALLEVPE